jgi:hypothetical protein
LAAQLIKLCFHFFLGNLAGFKAAAHLESEPAKFVYAVNPLLYGLLAGRCLSDTRGRGLFQSLDSPTDAHCLYPPLTVPGPEFFVPTRRPG